MKFKLKRRLLSIFTAAMMSLTAIPFASVPVVQAADTATPPSYGDVDLDGKIGDITDVVLLGKHLAGKLTLPSTSQNFINANCNVDGSLNASAVSVDDLKVMIDYMLGAIDSLPFGDDVISNFEVFEKEEVTLWKSSQDNVPSETLTIEVPAGDYTLSIKDNAIASLVENGDGTITLTPFNIGETVITATSPSGETDTLIVHVYISMPTFGTPQFDVSNVTIDLGAAATATVNVSDLETAAGDLVLTMADETIAQAVNNNGVVTITGLKGGTTTLTVTDEQGTTDTLEVIVTEPPTVEQPPVLEVDTVSVAKEESVTINVTDETVNELRAKIANNKIVSVSLSKGVLTVTGLSVGTTTVTITDATGLTAELTVTVTAANIPTIAGEIRNITAQQYVAEMNAGWNLGNTFDAWNDVEERDNRNYELAFEGNSSETSWGNPKTTKAMFEAVKAQGFDFVRIPTTWHNHFIDDQFTIDPDWMDRVQIVVNYALECDLKVILNTHHEGSVIIPTPENEAYDKEWITAVWNQIGDRFAGYGDALMFEGLNEPRTEGSQYEWNGGTSTDREVVNRLNQTFVDVIRAQGGNNATRFLLVPTYAAGVDNSLQPTYGAEQGGTHFVMPTDPANHTIVEVHAYTPWNFAGGGIEEGTYDQVFDQTDKDAISGMFDQIQRNLLDKGYAVILDEFGTRSTQEGGQRPYEGTSRMDWIHYYTQIANSKGIPCCVWDDGGWFVQLDRNSLTWLYPEYIDAFIEESFK